MKLIDVNQMAHKLCSTKATIYSWKSSLKIPKWCVMKLNGKLLFIEEQVDKWLESQYSSPLPSTP